MNYLSFFYLSFFSDDYDVDEYDDDDDDDDDDGDDVDGDPLMDPCSITLNTNYSIILTITIVYYFNFLNVPP